MIRKFIAECVCAGIELYMRRHRFGLTGMIEVRPYTHNQFKEHLIKVFQGSEEKADNYLSENVPTTEPHSEQ